LGSMKFKKAEDDFTFEFPATTLKKI
jgi:hypothetical protein